MFSRFKKNEEIVDEVLIFGDKNNTFDSIKSIIVGEPYALKGARTVRWERFGTLSENKPLKWIYFSTEE